MDQVSSLVSRRNILLGLAGGIAAGAANTPLFAKNLQAKAAALTPGGSKGTALGTATSDDWTAQVGSLFTAETGQVLQLTGVQLLAGKGTRPTYLRQQGFVTRFDVVSGGAMAEGTYRFRHKDGGTFDMHLAPAGSGQTLHMLAVFN